MLRLQPVDQPRHRWHLERFRIALPGCAVDIVNRFDQLIGQLGLRLGISSVLRARSSSAIVASSNSTAPVTSSSSPSARCRRRVWPGWPDLVGGQPLAFGVQPFCHLFAAAPLGYGHIQDAVDIKLEINGDIG